MSYGNSLNSPFSSSELGFLNATWHGPRCDLRRYGVHRGAQPTEWEVGRNPGEWAACQARSSGP